MSVGARSGTNFPKPANQACVRSTTQRCRPSRSLLSTLDGQFLPEFLVVPGVPGSGDSRNPCPHEATNGFFLAGGQARDAGSASTNASKAIES